MTVIEKFIEYKQTIGDRIPLYRSVTERFNVDTALYPGSHIDIMPSLVIPKVIYMDNFRGTIQFFKEIEVIRKYVESQKLYESDSRVTFLEGDYRNQYDIAPVDLIISQFAGFVGQEVKRYLKEGGILLCNDSHGDATLAYCDDDYEFIGIVSSTHTIEMDNLEVYFKFARTRPIDVEKVRTTMKGPKYKVKADNYLFRKKPIFKL